MARPAGNSSMDRLVRALAKLPGIGNRSAQRLAFHLIKAPGEEAAELADAITQLKKNTRPCRVCGNLTEGDVCAICGDPAREAGTILVVEQPSDLISFESTGLYKGVYHVLMGRLSPLDGVGPGELNIASLIERVKSPEGGAVREVILATNPTLEGDGTALYLSDALGKLGVKVSRLARGLPQGANMEWVSKAVLAEALQGRQPA